LKIDNNDDTLATSIQSALKECAHQVEEPAAAAELNQMSLRVQEIGSGIGGVLVVVAWEGEEE
jgi:Ethanolamine utilization protein EutJ (predicted chaperonin)